MPPPGGMWVFLGNTKILLMEVRSELQVDCVKSMMSSFDLMYRV